MSFRSVGIRVRETRTREDGLRYRRYDDGGVTFWTVELPLPVFTSAIRKDRLEKRFRSWLKNHQRKKVKAEAERRLRTGEKPLAIAHDLGLDSRTVHKYRREMR